MTIDRYLQNIGEAYQRGTATEHTHRGDLKQLIESLSPETAATNEPKRQACGAPDFILTKKDIPVGYIEAKDLGDKDLDGLKAAGNKEQFERYKASLGNLIFTDYIRFHLYRDGQLAAQIQIAEISGKGITPLPQNFAAFENLIKGFCGHSGQTIKTPLKLAAMMAGKARLLAGAMEKALIADTENQENSALKEQMSAVRRMLVHDMTAKGFADVYAQTIAYGMFAARLQDPAGSSFTRQKAAELIPKSNPFLRKLFGYIAGPELDDRIKWIVDDLADIFLACDVKEILKNYGKGTQTEDPIIHFYETFLGEYDPALRKARGVWYTPAPVVGFIVRAVDDILKTEFGLPDGLADISTVQPKGHLEPQGSAVPGGGVFHKVQILDPAAGTGTFLAEVVRHVHKNFEGREGAWGAYVDEHLLPRLNGFELLMASYAMAHLQLDLLLSETGHKLPANRRFKVYLTNSLQESRTELETGFADWLSNEANEANRIKNAAPVMCVIGNPPYSIGSTNKSAWIRSLIADYKEGLNERKINLDDDYIKFIRYGQHFIDKNGSGVLAYISNNSFLDGITHRQMRKNLLDSFDKIYVLDLHGSAKRKEVCPDGSPDQNVFDIMQGVSINIFVKTGKKKQNELGQVFRFDLQGKRSFKYSFLNGNDLGSVGWERLDCSHPNYFFMQNSMDKDIVYANGFKLTDLFLFNNTGIQTGKDSLVIDEDKAVLADRIKEVLDSQEEYKIRKKYGLSDTSGWTLAKFKKAVFKDSKIIQCDYRPFDTRFIFFDNHGLKRDRISLNKHILGKDNLSLSLKRQSKFYFSYAYIHKNICESCLFESAYANNSEFPLYLYPDDGLYTKKATEKELLVLKSKLAQAKEHYKTIKGFFQKTVLPFYNSINEPNHENVKLFEENKSTYEEAKAAVENLESQLKKAENAETGEQQSQERIPNLDKEILKKISDGLGLAFTDEKEASPSSPDHNSFAPIDLLDYIYAVLHSPVYREKYAEFLKTDFPKIPYPKDKGVFWRLAKLGGELRQTHLLENPGLAQTGAAYPVAGNNAVSKINYEGGKVYINENQYFADVPQAVWDFHIGGYQPAQKWLKDRKDRELGFEEIEHYQKITAALAQTDRLMGEIGNINIV